MKLATRLHGAAERDVDRNPRGALRREEYSNTAARLIRGNASELRYRPHIITAMEPISTTTTHDLQTSLQQRWSLYHRLVY